MVKVSAIAVTLLGLGVWVAPSFTFGKEFT